MGVVKTLVAAPTASSLMQDDAVGLAVVELEWWAEGGRRRLSDILKKLSL